MMVSDDAYAGGESYYKLGDAVKDVLGFKYYVPAHQGRAAEHLVAKIFIKPGQIIPMNYHFTTTKAHFHLAGGTVVELYTDEALKTQSDHPFKGNMDVDKLRALIAKEGTEKISFIRMEATTNLIGGQPFSLANLKEVRQVASQHHIPLIIDCSLISENAYFIKRREAGYADVSVEQIVHEMMSQADLIYLSGRKSACVRGGLLATNSPEYFEQLKTWLPLYEGFITYGGMSSKEIEAMAVGLREMTDYDVASSSADLIKYFVDEMGKRNIPAVTPPGGLAGHVDAMRFLPHVPQSQYTAGAMVAALYLVSGARGMERGTVSMDRDAQGNDVFSDVELCRLAVPRRVYSVSHMDYVVDRLAWLLEHRDLVGGLEFSEEPPVLRFFTGKLRALNNWGAKLAKAFEADFGPNC
jgi:tryptophanase